jgi:hypothetical protein
MVFVTGDLLSADARLNTRQPILAKPFAFERLEEALVAVMRGTPFEGGYRAPSGGRRKAVSG